MRAKSFWLSAIEYARRYCSSRFSLSAVPRLPVKCEAIALAPHERLPCGRLKSSQSFTDDENVRVSAVAAAVNSRRSLLLQHVRQFGDEILDHGLALHGEGQGPDHAHGGDADAHRHQAVDDAFPEPRRELGGQP